MLNNLLTSRDSMASFGQPPRNPVNSSPGNSPGVPDGIEILKYWFLGRRYTHSSPRKQPTLHDATIVFWLKWRLRNERRNSILMTRHYPDLGSASDWLKQISHPAPRPLRSTTRIWVVTGHQYGISGLVSHSSILEETSGCAAKCRLFSQAKKTEETKYQKITSRIKDRSPLMSFWQTEVDKQQLMEAVITWRRLRDVRTLDRLLKGEGSH